MTLLDPETFKTQTFADWISTHPVFQRIRSSWLHPSGAPG